MESNAYRYIYIYFDICAGAVAKLKLCMVEYDLAAVQ